MRRRDISQAFDLLEFPTQVSCEHVSYIWMPQFNTTNSGTAPSAELLATWNKREGELIAAHANSVPPVAFPPEPIGTYVGQNLDAETLKRIANEGARTIPGREHGGNCDVGPLYIFILSILVLTALQWHGRRSRTSRGKTETAVGMTDQLSS